jgi:peroxiredoxin Q/BCP
MLEIGNAAPDFRLLDQDEQEQSLSGSQGKWCLVYFYPKDDTPGCTKEACAITEIYDEYEALGVTVFGISKDSPQ